MEMSYAGNTMGGGCFCSDDEKALLTEKKRRHSTVASGCLQTSYSLFFSRDIKTSLSSQSIRF